MGQLYVYEPWPTAVDTMGLCGPLLATKATCTHEKNGDFRLDIEHPIDKWGKWANLVPGNLIRADVPMRTLPQMEYGTTNVIPMMRRATVKNVSREARAVYPWYGSGTTDMRLFTLDVGTMVYEVEVLTVGAPYTNIRWPGGNGWILRSSLENFVDINMASPTTATLESYIPAPRARSQLFRINSIDLSDKGVNISAKHVFYDNLANITSYSTKNTDAYTAITSLDGGIRDNRIKNKVSPEIQTNLTGTKDVSAWTRVSFVEALMSPDSGVLGYWNGEIMRDNWVTRLVDAAGINKGFAIEYGRNMLGVKYSFDTADMVTQLLPVGQTTKGKPLVISNDYYDPINTIFNGVVFSPHDSGLPIPHIEVYDLGSKIKATGTTSSALNAAYAKLVNAVLDKFAKDQCDLPTVTLNVDFLMLGDSAEYAQYRNLQKVFLYDTVRVKHPGLGIDVTTQVNKTEWDCLLDRYNSIELGTVRKSYARSRVAPWQVPGLASLKSSVSTLTDLV